MPNKTTKPTYQLSLEMLGKTYTTESKTVEEGLSDLAVKHKLVKAKGFLKVKKGNKTCEQLFFIPELRRLFANRLARQIWGKRLELRTR